MKTLADVARAVGAEAGDWGSKPIVDLTHDSRAVSDGWFFCCLPGLRVDGHDFAPAAMDAGAVGLLVERELPIDLPQLVVADARRAMGLAAAEVHGHPSSELCVVGVTGTNGKSSIVQLLADILDRAGRRTEIYGTLTGSRTTPESSDLQRQLAASRDRKTEAVALEVSSHALELSRVVGTRFAAAIFTNLGHDHLDFHHDMESYFLAKAKLFDPAFTDTCIINADDAYGARLLAELPHLPERRLIAYSVADAEDLRFEGATTRFRWRGHEIVLRLAGRHNVSNALAAAATAAELGVATDIVADGLCATEPVRGRFELINIGQPFTLAIDYAHTPDALAAVLSASREVTDQRVILVFGCGGDRDRDKRREMGEVAGSGADLVVVTSDNPRGEDPSSIIAEVLNGLTGQTYEVQVEPDRRVAIGFALGQAQPGDLVLIAGKGHETFQVIGDRELPFDDRQVALEELGAIT